MLVLNDRAIDAVLDDHFDCEHRFAEHEHEHEKEKEKENQIIIANRYLTRPQSAC